MAVARLRGSRPCRRHQSPLQVHEVEKPEFVRGLVGPATEDCDLVRRYFRCGVFCASRGPIPSTRRPLSERPGPLPPFSRHIEEVDLFEAWERNYLSVSSEGRAVIATIRLTESSTSSPTPTFLPFLLHFMNDLCSLDDSLLAPFSWTSSGESNS